LIEPGRFISGNAGILVTRVEYVKRTGRKNFVIVDAAMNDLIRPAFYDAYHEIVPLTKKRRRDDFVRRRRRRFANPAIIFARTVRCRKSAKAITSRC
jgi:diaminopimelate decarboxylase